MIILDTSFIIKLFKNEKKAVMAFKSIQLETLYISTITLAELQIGFLRINKSPTFINEIISSLTKEDTCIILKVDTEISLQYAKNQADLMAAGYQIGSFDGLIAATAIVHNLKLVTFDSDFKRVQKLNLHLIQ